MKTIGLLGGMSWESTVPYYQTINRVVGERLGGLHSARIVPYTAERITAAGLRRVGLLATKFTMEDEFYRGRLQSRHGLEVLVPPAEDRAIVHRIIYEELCLGRVREDSRAQCRRIMDDLARRKAEGVILGCTEIGLLVRPEDGAVPLFDTTQIHAEAAARYALGVA